MSFRPGRCLSLAVIFVSMAGEIRPQNADKPSISTLTSDQIVAQIQRFNQSQAEGLKHYQSVRSYQVEYHGFKTTVVAKMEVEVKYDASSGKSFRIVSQSGSKLLCEKVLKRAVESEMEASRDKDAAALTQANYRFHLVGSESLGGRSAYILDVEPRTKGKFIYRGKIWVDAADFAVAKIEAEPAKNPSFWIVRTLIRHTNARTGGFWLPEKNRSETKVRIGGTAVLTIDYGIYQIVSN